MPDGVANSPTSYAVNLQALCVLLLVVHAVPVHRCAQLIARAMKRKRTELVTTAEGKAFPIVRFGVGLNPVLETI